MAMMFDVSDIWPTIGMALVVLSGVSAIIGAGGQVMLWITGG